MGIFSRNKDEAEEYIEEQPALHPVATPVAPSVDGVLPPGVTPAPAPAGNNLASQTVTPPQPVSAPATAASSSDDSAGDYIMTAPPMGSGSQADEWSESPQPAPAQSATAPIEDAQHLIEPAYSDMEQSADVTNVPVTDTQVGASEPVPAQANDMPEPRAPEPAESSEPTEPQAPASTPAPSSDLADIKQQALSSLSPLVGHLNQSPEEKFHTTMMLLQSTDDQSLIKTAYEAAQAISDDKTRAQALLDIVNEINYFTQKNNE